MTRLVIGSLGIAAATLAAGDAQAQIFYHRHYHSNYSNSYSRPQHYHDSAGHIVDRNGHHVDAYGRHTGSVGVYDQHSVPTSNGYGVPYITNYGGGNYGGSYSGASVAPNRAPDFGLPIYIDSPPAVTTAINYTLNGRRYTIQPGERHTLVNDRSWLVQFDRGGEYGFTEYALTPGTYEFEATPQGWELYRLTRPQAAAPVPSAPSLPLPNPLPPTARPATVVPSTAVPPAAVPIDNVPRPRNF